MTTEIEILCKLSCLDDKIFEMSDTAKRLPEQLEKEEGHLRKLEEECALLAEDIKGVQVEANKSELDASQIEEQAISFKVKLNTIKTNEEYRLITAKIKELNEKKSAMEEKALEFLTEADFMKEKLAGLKGEIEEEKKRLATVKLEVEQKVSELKKEIALLEEERAQYPPQLTPENYDKYRRALGKIGHNVVVPIMDDLCSGCNMTIRPNNISMVMSGKIVTCTHCNRIFYIKESEE